MWYFIIFEIGSSSVYVCIFQIYFTCYPIACGNGREKGKPKVFFFSRKLAYRIWLSIFNRYGFCQPKWKKLKKKLTEKYSKWYATIQNCVRRNQFRIGKYILSSQSEKEWNKCSKRKIKCHSNENGSNESGQN